MFKTIAIGICLYIFSNWSSNDTLSAQSTRDAITIVFHNTPNYAKKIEVAKNIFVENSHPIILIYDNFHASFFEPGSAKSSDTLKILPTSPYILVKHSFNTISFMYYLFKKGDSVIFSYENGIPVAKILNRPVKKYDVNFELGWRNEKLAGYPYTPYEIYLTPLFAKSKTDQANIINLRYKVKKENYYLSKIYFSKEQSFLDSIKNIEEISSEYYLFYSDKCKYLTATMNVEQDDISIDSLTKILPPNNPQLPYSFYYNFITSVVNHTIEKESKTIFFSNGQIADYRQIFDSVAKSSYIRSPYKDLLLHKYLMLIATSFPIEDFETYFSRFKRLSRDTLLVENIKANYLTNFSNFKHALDTLYLLNTAKSTFTLTDILNKNKGKMIYIDFWASWCAPCRAAMKSSMLLRNEYKTKNVLFLYLSIDNDFSAWKKANEEEGLNKYDNSLFILNHQTNRFLKEIKLVSIPRYLLFDKKGKLIHQNAPSPKSKEIRKLISE